MSVIRRYSAEEVAEFIQASADMTGLSNAEIVEALDEHAMHMEAGGFAFGATTTEGAVEALRKLAEIHHGTLTPSKLHDPHTRDWTECECKSCRLAQPFGGR